MRSLCQAADDRLTAFIDTLQLDCLDIYKDSNGEYRSDSNANKDLVDLPQVSYLFISHMFILVVDYYQMFIVHCL